MDERHHELQLNLKHYLFYLDHFFTDSDLVTPPSIIFISLSKLFLISDEMDSLKSLGTTKIISSICLLSTKTFKEY